MSGTIYDIPIAVREKCRSWFLSHTGREPTYGDYRKWQKRQAEWDEEKTMNEMYRFSDDHSNAGDRV